MVQKNPKHSASRGRRCGPGRIRSRSPSPPGEDAVVAPAPDLVLSPSPSHSRGGTNDSHASSVASVAEEYLLSAIPCEEDAVLHVCCRRAAHVRFHLQQHHPLGLYVSRRISNL